MHANLISADKIKRECDKAGYFDFKIYERTSERQQIKRMKRGDIGLIIQTQPKHYAGAIALCEIVEVNAFQPRVKFLRYLKRKIMIEELKKMDSVFQQVVGIITIPEQIFN